MELFKINEVILDDELYNDTISSIIEELEEDYLKRKERILVEFSDETKDLNLGNLLTTLIICLPFNKFKQEVSSKFSIDSNITGDVFEDHHNNVIDLFKDADPTVVREHINKSIEELDSISGRFSEKNGNTINLYGLHKLAKSNKEFNALINTTLSDKKMQFNEIEKYVDDQMKDALNILSTEPNILYNYIKSKTGINIDQLKQAIINIALKPDLEGNVIPEPIDTNFLHGFRNIIDFYINALGSRKALITNHSQVKTSGYLTRKLSLLCIDTSIDSEVDDCGSWHYLKTYIGSKDTLKRLDGRWFANDDETELVLINRDKEELIGKTVKLRSPITCHLKDGKVCCTCYGDRLAKINKDYHVGIIAVLILTDQLTQRLLSSKHLLKTQSAEINWGDNFTKYLAVDRSTVLSNTDNVNNFIISIDQEDFIEDDNDRMKIKNFTIIDGENEIPVSSPLSLFITDETMENLESYKDDHVYNIPIKSSDNEKSLFYFIMENNELSASLDAIIDLIETNDHLGLTDIHDIFNRFLELLKESKIKINSVHVELILKELLRYSEDETKYINFEEYDELPPYRVLRVTDAIIKSPSVFKALSFEQIRKQLEDPKTYYKKAESLLDSLIS